MERSCPFTRRTRALKAVTPEMMLKSTIYPTLKALKTATETISTYSTICGFPEALQSSAIPTERAMEMGDKGAIAGYANGLPDVYSDSLKTIKSGDTEAAKRKQFEINMLRISQKPL
ncbi:hypothetical protein ACFL0D_01805 [Thermoproteota archaeon]